jgi:Arc/MetJ family transcription regulator
MFPNAELKRRAQAAMSNNCTVQTIHIDVDEKLLRRAMRRSWAKTKKATVEAALRLLSDMLGQASVRRLRGKIEWQGNLEQSRLSRFRGR